MIIPVVFGVFVVIISMLLAYGINIRQNEEDADTPPDLVATSGGGGTGGSAESTESVVTTDTATGATASTGDADGTGDDAGDHVTAIVQVASDGRVFNETETFINPHSDSNSNVLIEIAHIAIHHDEEGSITWHYKDGTTDTITVKGNNNQQFKDSEGIWSEWLGGNEDHTTTIVEHTSLINSYRFERVNGGVHRWEFESKSGGVIQIVISHTGTQWSGFETPHLKWM